MQLRAATKQTRFGSSEKGSIQSISKKGFQERFYRHIFSWFIYPLPFETSGTASHGSIWYGKIGSLDPSTYNIDFALYTKQRSGSHIDFDRNIIDFGLNLHNIHLRNGLSIRALCKPCTRGRGRHCCIRRHGLIAIKAILYAIVLCRVITTSM